MWIDQTFSKATFFIKNNLMEIQKQEDKGESWDVLKILGRSLLSINKIPREHIYILDTTATEH